jgi:galactoside O-acetyltransferase
LGQTGKGLVVQTGVVVTGHPNIKIWTNVKLSRSCVLYAHAGSIEMGDSTAVNSNTIVNAADGGEIIIGKDVLIAQNVVLRASDHY